MLPEDKTNPPADAGLVDQGVGRLAPGRASLGDTIACDVRMPRPETIAMRLDTQAAVDHANQVLAAPNSGWRLLRKGTFVDLCPHADGGPYYMPPNA